MSTLTQNVMFLSESEKAALQNKASQLFDEAEALEIFEEERNEYHLRWEYEEDDNGTLDTNFDSMLLSGQYINVHN